MSDFTEAVQEPRPLCAHCGNPDHWPVICTAMAAVLASSCRSGNADQWIKPDPIEHAGITVGEITAWRCWETHDGFLKSVHMDTIWPPGEPMTDDGKLDASDYHSYGIHAWRTKAEALQYGGDSSKRVIGEVALWGEVVEHEHGYRAQFAKPLAIHYAVGNVSPIELQAIAINYGMPAKGGGMFDALTLGRSVERDPVLRRLQRLKRICDTVMVVSFAGAVVGLAVLALKATGYL